MVVEGDFEEQIGISKKALVISFVGPVYFLSLNFADYLRTIMGYLLFNFSIELVILLQFFD